LVAHCGPTAQQPLRCCPVRANIPDAFIIHSIGKRTGTVCFYIITSFLAVSLTEI
jgi:hypothetical protein